MTAQRSPILRLTRSKVAVDLREIELQQFLNDDVSTGASRSKVSKMLLYMRTVLDHAVMKKIIGANPARNRLSSESKVTKAYVRRLLSMDECQRAGADHLAIRIVIQLGLPSEELFALHCDDLLGDALRIDQALLDGVPAPAKTDASDASVCLPPDLQIEMNAWLEWLSPDRRGWLFPAAKGGPWSAQNCLNWY
ncbi:MAG: hypothetical protein WB992_00770 [Bryobacteraceae bacterium]